MSNGISGFTLGFAAQVKNGVIHGDIGFEGKPGWRTLDGKIEPNGSALLKDRGLHADPNPYNIKPGTPYSNDVVAQLDATRGTGKRVAGRQCDYTFTRYQLAAAKEDASVAIDLAGTTPGARWKVTAQGGERCFFKNWTTLIEVIGETITSNSKIKGHVNSDGSFKFYQTSFSGEDGAIVGKFEGDTGKGTYFYESNSCAGTIVLDRVPG